MPQSRIYDLATRWFGASWFLLLAYIVGLGVYHESHTLAIIAKSCLVIFNLMLCLLLLIRPQATSQTRGFIPRLAAFGGTYGIWVLALFPQTKSASLDLLSTICLIVGLVLAIITVAHLGKSFSIVPQAREFVRSGPYRWLRHPLYAAEQIAVFGTLLQVISPYTVAIFIIHIAVQICRIVYEERLLRQTFPDYNIYATTTWRLLPYVW
jgi:protein-S-isoprenylcysteine O-methyltransferase Ste14